MHPAIADRDWMRSVSINITPGQKWVRNGYDYIFPAEEWMESTSRYEELRTDAEPNAINIGSERRYEELRTDAEPNAINIGSEQTRERRSSSGDTHRGRYWPLYRMIQKKNWQAVEYFIRNHPDAMTAKIDTNETLLELIIRFGDYKANWLIDRLVQPNFEGETVHTFCAASGNLKALEVLVREKPNLPNIRCSKGFLPVHYAALYGQKDALQFLLPKTAGIDRGRDGVELLVRLIYANLYASTGGTRDLELKLCSRISTYGACYPLGDMALDLLKRHPAIGRDHITCCNKVLRVMAEKPLAFENVKGSGLGRWQRIIYDYIPVKKERVSSIQTDYFQTADERDFENLTARSFSHFKKSPTFGSVRQITTTFGAMCHKLHMMLWSALMHLAPSIKVIHEEKVRHMQAVEIVRIICKGVIWNDPQNQNLLTKALFKAATLGISKFVQEIIAAYSGSVYWQDENKHTIFHVAVLHRHAEVFNLIRSSNFKLNWLGIEDINRNNILHFAGKLVPSSEVPGAALQMQRELQWFKAVENLVHPFFREAVNNDYQTPREVFTKEHKELVKDGEKWMKETATSCSVVAALIITVMFAAAFTAPGGNDSQGIPNMLHQSSFIIFAVSDALSLFSSIISVLMFLGILTSRYSEEDFLLSLPRKLIIGLVAMFFSIASMMVAFGATIYLVLFRTWKWVFIPTSLVGCVPVSLFAFLQVPLLVEMYSSTYGRGIFGSM